MFLGHFAVGFAAKRAAPRASLGTLMMAPLRPDLLWPIVLLLGLERVRIDPGNTQWSLATTPKVVSGVEANSKRAMEAFYGSLVEKVVPVKSTGEAELTKLLENTFRHVNIALVNELAVLCADQDIDVWEVIAAAAVRRFARIDTNMPM